MKNTDRMNACKGLTKPSRHPKKVRPKPSTAAVAIKHFMIFIFTPIKKILWLTGQISEEME